VSILLNYQHLEYTEVNISIESIKPHVRPIISSPTLHQHYPLPSNQAVWRRGS